MFYVFVCMMMVQNVWGVRSEPPLTNISMQNANNIAESQDTPSFLIHRVYQSESFRTAVSALNLARQDLPREGVSPVSPHDLFSVIVNATRQYQAAQNFERFSSSAFWYQSPPSVYPLFERTTLAKQQPPAAIFQLTEARVPYTNAQYGQAAAALQNTPGPLRHTEGYVHHLMENTPFPAPLARTLIEDILNGDHQPTDSEETP